MENKNYNEYGKVGNIKLLDIIVNLDGQKIYERLGKNAPERVQNYIYSDVKVGNKIIYNVYSKDQKNV